MKHDENGEGLKGLVFVSKRLTRELARATLDAKSYASCDAISVSRIWVHASELLSCFKGFAHLPIVLAG